MNALQDRVGVVALLQQDDAFDGVGIVDDRVFAVLGEVPGPADLAQSNLRSLLTVPMSLILMAAPLNDFTTVLSMSCTEVKRPSDCTLICWCPPQ